ncbi:MAG: hypothetical protein ACRDBO_15195 [Lachnospiraceae bacterium]
MKRRGVQVLFFIFTVGTIVLSILGPEALSNYKDKTILNQIHIQTAEAVGQGYRYALNSTEKLYIVSQALSSQNQQMTGHYAFVLNYQEPDDKAITDAEIFDICNQELAYLHELGILPGTLEPVEKTLYEAVLYTAIDVLEPRNHVAVWKLSLSNIQKNSNKQKRVIDIYLDADSRKVYQIFVRTDSEWENIDTDFIMETWSRYMEIEIPIVHEQGNPLMETTPYFSNYAVTGEGDEKTVVTIGFYEGINELFLKISRLSM